MRKQVQFVRNHLFVLALAIVLVFAAPLGSVYAELVERIDGRVIGLDVESNMLRIDFQHPVTKESIEKVFKVADNTGFKNIKRLAQLRKGDLVSIDFREDVSDQRTTLTTVYVIYIPLEKQFVSHSELATAMSKIKPTPKQ